MVTSPIPEYAISKGWGKIILEPLNGDIPEAANVPYIIMATNPDVIKNKRPQLLAMVRCWTRAMDIVRDKGEFRVVGILAKRGDDPHGLGELAEVGLGLG